MNIQYITMNFIYNTYILDYLLNLPDMYSFKFTKYKVYNHNYTYENIVVN